MITVQGAFVTPQAVAITASAATSTLAGGDITL